MTTTAPELSALRSRGRRCPWYRDVIDLAAAPRSPYDGHVGICLIFAGSNAWEMAKPGRDNAKRAITVLPPGADPREMRWPPVATWMGDTGDLDAQTVVTLGRVLIGAGALYVSLRSKTVAGRGLTMRVAP